MNLEQKPLNQPNQPEGESASSETGEDKEIALLEAEVANLEAELKEERSHLVKLRQKLNEMELDVYDRRICRDDIYQSRLIIGNIEDNISKIRQKQKALRTHQG